MTCYINMSFCNFWYVCLTFAVCCFYVGTSVQCISVVPSCSIAIGDVTSLRHESGNDPVESTALEGEIATCVRDHSVSWCLCFILFSSQKLWGRGNRSYFLRLRKKTQQHMVARKQKSGRVACGRHMEGEAQDGTRTSWKVRSSWFARMCSCRLQSSQLTQTMAEQLMNPKPPPPDVAFLSSAKASKVLSLKRQKHSVGYLCTKKGSEIAKKSNIRN